MNVKKLVTWLVVSAVIVILLKTPEHAARFVSYAGHGLGDAASALASFVGSLG